jgi:TonB family protein
LSKCHEIERLLWDYPDGPLSPADKQKVSDHLETCAACRAALSTIEAVRESKAADSRVISAVDPDAFDNRVMQKILKATAPPLRRKSDEGYPLRMALSVGLAAAITIFLVFSVSDMQDLTMMQDRVPVPAGAEEKTYERMDIHLVPEEGREEAEKQAVGYMRDGRLGEDSSAVQPLSPSPPTPGPAPEEPGGVAEEEAVTGSVGEELKKEAPTPPPAGDVATLSEQRPEEAGQVPEKALTGEPDLTIEEPPQPEIDKFTSLPPSFAADTSHLESLPRVHKRITAEAERLEGKGQSFSILPSPVTRPAPDSVNIEGVYLTDEAVPIVSQLARASMSEVVVDTGMIQSAERPQSVLVTVEKMPVAVDIVPPEYPVWAKKRQLSGVVWVKARVDENGVVTQAAIVSSSLSGAGFEEASLEAARESKYRPAEANGNKIPVWIIYPVKFIYKN